MCFFYLLSIKKKSIAYVRASFGLWAQKINRLRIKELNTMNLWRVGSKVRANPLSETLSQQ